MSQKITATHERVDDIPAIIAHLKTMRVAELLDNHFPTNGNWEGLSLGWTTVVAGNTADDPLYLPEIAKIRQLAGSCGLTYVGDCTMAALGTRAEIAAHGDYYLCPLSAKQMPEVDL